MEVILCLYCDRDELSVLRALASTVQRVKFAILLYSSVIFRLSVVVRCNRLS